MRTTTHMLALSSLLAALGTAFLYLSGMTFLGLYIGPILASAVLIAAMEECTAAYARMCFAVIALLGVLLCPDKECAFLFLFLGWYPLARPRLNRIGSRAVRVMAKGAILVVSMTLVYTLLIYVVGLETLVEEQAQLAGWMLAATAVLGAALFAIYDRMLESFTVIYRRKRKHRKTNN